MTIGQAVLAYRVKSRRIEHDAPAMRQLAAIVRPVKGEFFDPVHVGGPPDVHGHRVEHTGAAVPTNPQLARARQVDDLFEPREPPAGPERTALAVDDD